MKKKNVRLKRARKIRAKIGSLNIDRLTVHRTSQHVYAQVISGSSKNVIAQVSTVQQEVRSQLVAGGGNKVAASLIGTLIAEKAISKGVSKVAFDRSGFNYHGRVKALAEAAREAGLQF